MANISVNNYRLPSSDDFSGAVTALQRLQKTYQVPASSMSSGKVSAAPSLSMTGEALLLQYSVDAYSKCVFS